MDDFYLWLELSLPTCEFCVDSALLFLRGGRPYDMPSNDGLSLYIKFPCDVLISPVALGMFLAIVAAEEKFYESIESSLLWLILYWAPICEDETLPPPGFRESYFSRNYDFLTGALGGPDTPSSFLFVAVVRLEKKF